MQIDEQSGFVTLVGGKFLVSGQNNGWCHECLKQGLLEFGRKYIDWQNGVGDGSNACGFLRCKIFL